MRFALAAFLLVLFPGLSPSAAGQACPVAGVGASPCAVVTLVALEDQADALGLDGVQREEISRIRRAELGAVHDVLGDIQSLQEAMHTLDRPFDPAEVFALVYELDRHQAELAETLEAAQAALLDVLTEAQRTRWAERLAAATAIQDPAAAGASRGDAP